MPRRASITSSPVLLPLFFVLVLVGSCAHNAPPLVPNLPNGYYSALEISPDDLLTVYFGRFGNPGESMIWILGETFNSLYLATLLQLGEFDTLF